MNKIMKKQEKNKGGKNQIRKETKTTKNKKNKKLRHVALVGPTHFVGLAHLGLKQAHDHRPRVGHVSSPL
jgi:hypothetical protein